jgi:tetratricopeptide (TPR) repeat protein
MLGFVLTSFTSVGRAQMTGANFGECGSLENGYGPYDYTNPTHRKEKLPKVERYHFTGYVYRLEGGLTNVTAGGDLDYTLRAFPNHHLALDAMARLHRREKAEQVESSRYTLSCWFERARRFAPDDPAVRLIEGIHYLAVGDLDTAEQALLGAIKLDPNSPEIAYNLGLLYERKGDFDQAKKYAVMAYHKGYPLPGLKRKLIKKGVWIDEPDVDAPQQD